MIQEFSISDPYWHHENLQTLPFPVIADFVEGLQRAKKRDQNLVQAAMSQYAAAKFSTEDKPFDPNRLLPWPPSQLSGQAETMTLLQQLVDLEVLPPRAHSAAMSRLRK